MGAKQSALKKEVAALQQEARKRSAKHQEELTIATKEKRQLQLKIDELQALVTQAQEEAEKTKSEAHEREERMKALKWELVRQLRLTGSPTSTSTRASLSPSSSTRIALNWRLNEDVSLRQSAVSPKKTPSNTPVQTTPTNSTNHAVKTTTPQATPSHVASNDTEVTENRSMLLAPRRSLIKRSEAAATPVTNLNQTPDAGIKENSNASEKTFKMTTPSTTPRESESSTSDSPASDAKNVVSKSLREPKSESKSDDPQSDNKSDSSSQSKRLPSTESKDRDDDSPETIDVHRFSEDDSS